MENVFGPTLNRLRKEMGLSLAELAAKLNESETIIENIESGYMQADDDLLGKLAVFFGVNEQYLLGQIDGEQAVCLSDFFRETLVFKESDLSGGVLNENQAIDKLKVCLTDSSDERMAIRVESNDMKNSRIEEGDNIIVKLQRTARDNDIVLVKTPGNQVLIRRYMRSGNTIRLFADPVGAKIQEITYNVSDERYIIIGKVVACSIKI